MILLDESTRDILAPAVSILLHGLTGGGKSTFAETGGVPLVLLTEAKAMSVLRQINPAAIGFAPECLEDLDALLEVLGEMHDPTGRPMLLALWNLLYRLDPEVTDPKRAAVLALAGRLAKVDRIVLDSFTELTNALPRWLREQGGAAQGVLLKLEIQEYGSLKDYALAIVKAVQLSGLPSVIIARSVSKKVGLAESIRPDGAGKSVEDLPGKLLPTAEARIDPEKGFVIDTTPAEHSQRCGLPWVPMVFVGTVLEYLQIIQAGPQQVAPSAAGFTAQAGPAPEKAAVPATSSAPESPKTAAPAAPATPPPPPKGKRGPKPHAPAPAEPIPGADDPAWNDLMGQLAEVTITRPVPERQRQIASWEQSYATNPGKAKTDLDIFIQATRRLASMTTTPDPERDPDGYRDAFGAVCTTLTEERRAKESKVSQGAADFVDGMADGHFGPADAPAPQAPASGSELEAMLGELADLLRRKGIPGMSEAAIKGSVSSWRDFSQKDTVKLQEALVGLRREVAEVEAKAGPAAPATPAGDSQPPRAKAEDVTEILDLAAAHKVNLAALWKYAQAKGSARTTPEGSPNWMTLSAVFVERIVPQMRDEEKRRAFLPWLHNTYSASK